MSTDIHTKKAVINYIDVLGRASLITEDNEALVLRVPDGKVVSKGDTVVISRPAAADQSRRMTDWKIL